MNPKRWLHRLVGVQSPSREWERAALSVDWPAILQPPRSDGTPWVPPAFWPNVSAAEAGANLAANVRRMGVAMPGAGITGTAPVATEAELDPLDTQRPPVTPRDTHSPEQETTTMDHDNEDLWQEVDDLRTLTESLSADLQDARHEAITKGLEATNWECLALEKDATLLATQGALMAEREHRGTVETLAAVWQSMATPRVTLGGLNETTETYDPGPGRLWVVEAGEVPHLSDLADADAIVASALEHALNAAGIDALCSLPDYVLRHQLMGTIQMADLVTKVHRLLADSRQLSDELDAKVAGYADAANDLTNHLAVNNGLGRYDGWQLGVLLDLVNGLRSHAGLPTLAQIPEAPEQRTPGGASSTAVENPVENGSGDPEAPMGETWTTVVGDLDGVATSHAQRKGSGE